MTVAVDRTLNMIVYLTYKNRIGSIKSCQTFWTKNCVYFLIPELKHVFWVLRKLSHLEGSFSIHNIIVLVEK